MRRVSSMQFLFIDDNSFILMHSIIQFRYDKMTLSFNSFSVSIIDSIINLLWFRLDTFSIKTKDKNLDKKNVSRQNENDIISSQAQVNLKCFYFVKSLVKYFYFVKNFIKIFLFCKKFNKTLLFCKRIY